PKSSAQDDPDAGEKKASVSPPHLTIRHARIGARLSDFAPGEQRILQHVLRVRHLYLQRRVSAIGVSERFSSASSTRTRSFRGYFGHLTPVPCSRRCPSLTKIPRYR